MQELFCWGLFCLLFLFFSASMFAPSSVAPRESVMMQRCCSKVSSSRGSISYWSVSLCWRGEICFFTQISNSVQSWIMTFWLYQNVWSRRMHLAGESDTENECFSGRFRSCSPGAQHQLSKGLGNQLLFFFLQVFFCVCSIFIQSTLLAAPPDISNIPYFILFHFICLSLNGIYIFFFNGRSWLLNIIKTWSCRENQAGISDANFNPSFPLLLNKWSQCLDSLCLSSASLVPLNSMDTWFAFGDFSGRVL